jgi:hypothetical protein
MQDGSMLEISQQLISVTLWLQVVVAQDIQVLVAVVQVVY